MDWRDLAACRDADPEGWFPVGNDGPALIQVAEAKTVCRGCPVREACLDWAMTHPDTHGIWGGLTEGERRTLRRQDTGITIMGVA